MSGTSRKSATGARRTESEKDQTNPNPKDETKLELFGDDSEEETTGVKVNEKFASKFEAQQRFKDLQRMKDMDLDGEDDDSESDESEDSDAELLDVETDKKIIETIVKIRRRDPTIYDPSTKFFEEKEQEDGDSDEEHDGKHKKKTYKDVLREQLLKGATGEDSDDESHLNTHNVPKSNSKSSLAYDVEQESIRQAFLKAGSIESGDDSDSDPLFSKARRIEKDAAAEAELQEALKEMSATAPADEGEAFLTQFFTKKMWKDSSHSKKKMLDDVDDSEDEEELNAMDDFESKYNFRFEEMQNSTQGVEGMQVTGHARQVEGTLRREDDKRKKAREERKERKEHEKRQKEAEIRRLKNLKREELKSRLSKIADIGGLAELGVLDDKFLDDDWDPESHEKFMAAQFSDEYYNAEDDEFATHGGMAPEELKKLLGDDELPVGADEWYQGEEGEEAYEDDGSYHTSNGTVLTSEQIELAKKIMAEGTQELYDLDYEDMIDGMPTRFKYMEVEPEDYGLTAEEILLADDKDLNNFLSLKHLAPYRKDSKSKAELSKKRAALRAKLNPLFETLAEAEEKKKKKSEKKKAAAQAAAEAAAQAAATTEVSGEKSKRKRRKRKDGESSEMDGLNLITPMSKEEIAAELAQDVSEPPAKKTKKAVADDSSSDDDETTVKNSEDKKQKRKRKRTGPKKTVDPAQARRALFK